MKANPYRNTILIILVINLFEFVHANAKGGSRGRSSGGKGGISGGGCGGRGGGGGRGGEVKNSTGKGGINSSRAGGGVYAYGGSNCNKELFNRYVGIRICVSVFVMISITL